MRIFDPWNSPLCTCPLKYSLHPYTGCSHRCLYCYATAYIGRKPSSPKKDFWKRLRHDLRFVNRELIIELSTSSDPYPPLEEWLYLTRVALEILASNNMKILITTKSDLVIRDIDVLLSTPSAVMITITSLDKDLIKRLEPGAPSPARRIHAIRILSNNKVPVGVRIDPIIPGLNNDPYMLRELVHKVVDAGAMHIVTSTYKARPDNFKRLIEAFPDLSSYWRKIYYEEGVKIHGYRYLRQNIRKELLKPVVTEAREQGITYATCREGFLDKEYFNSPSCDGSHLIKYSPKYNEFQGSVKKSYRLL
ncbi:MAG: radical SAM protein [Thermoprotei archaeon]|nr:MAG: radical SAM protein [Thermoprotei archaeon]